MSGMSDGHPSFEIEASKNAVEDGFDLLPRTFPADSMECTLITYEISVVPSDVDRISFQSDHVVIVSSKASSVAHVDITVGEFRRRWLLRVLILAAIFVAYLAAIVSLLRSFPPLDVVDKGSLSQSLLKFPRTLEEIRRVKTTLGLYQQKHGARVVLCFVATYLLLQTFIIPGSLLLSILGGSLFGFYWGLLLVSVVGAVGASCCYGLSRFLLKDLVHVTLAKRCDWLRSEVRRHRHNLVFYIVFLRITPMAPHWFVNVAAPIVSVPFRHFFVGTFLGFIPSVFVSIKAGTLLNSTDSAHHLYDWQTIFMLIGLALLSLLPVVLKWSIRNRKKTTA